MAAEHDYIKSLFANKPTVPSTQDLLCALVFEIGSDLTRITSDDAFTRTVRPGNVIEALGSISYKLHRIANEQVNAGRILDDITGMKPMTPRSKRR